MSHIVMVMKSNKKQTLITYITEFIYLLIYIYMNIAFLHYSTHLIVNWDAKGYQNTNLLSDTTYCW
jgi:hypothetical protein